MNKIFIEGSGEIIDSANCKALGFKGYSYLNRKTCKELDLSYQKAVNDFDNHEKPDLVINKKNQYLIEVVYKIYSQ